MTEEEKMDERELSQHLSVEERLSENALQVFRRRYVRKGSDGEPVETV